MTSVEREPILHLGGSSPNAIWWVMEQSPGVESEGRGPPEAERLCLFYTKEGQKLRI